MRIDLHETLRKIEKNLPEDKVITFKMLEQAYGHTMRLRSQILSVMDDMVDFGPAKQLQKHWEYRPPRPKTRIWSGW